MSTWLAVSQRVTDGRVKHSAYILSTSEVHDFIKRLPAVILADSISFLEANMIVGSDEDANCIGLCKQLATPMEVRYTKELYQGIPTSWLPSGTVVLCAGEFLRRFRSQPYFCWRTVHLVVNGAVN